MALFTVALLTDDLLSPTNYVPTRFDPIHYRLTYPYLGGHGAGQAAHAGPEGHQRGGRLQFDLRLSSRRRGNIT